MIGQINNAYSSDKVERDRQIDAWESKKPALHRYPTNADSIGIEVVGAPEEGVYGKPSDAQNRSCRWLVRELLVLLSLSRDRIFPHGLIAPHKFPSEGVLIAY